jgi:hypothetical protein
MFAYSPIPSRLQYFEHLGEVAYQRTRNFRNVAQRKPVNCASDLWMFRQRFRRYNVNCPSGLTLSPTLNDGQAAFLDTSGQLTGRAGRKILNVLAVLDSIPYSTAFSRVFELGRSGSVKA